MCFLRESLGGGKTYFIRMHFFLFNLDGVLWLVGDKYVLSSNPTISLLHFSKAYLGEKGA